MSVARACLLLALPWAAACGAPAPRPLVVAAAASLRPALDAIAAEFAGAGVALEVVYGASGQLVAQLEQGAGFGVFLGADREHAERLVRLGRAGEVFEYGRGRLLLWVREASPLHPERDGLAILDDPRVLKIAVANPRLSPYGAMALAILERAGLRSKVEARLVFAENVAQALHFAVSGAADVAFVAASLVAGRQTTVRGRFVEVEVAGLPPLSHCGVVLTPNAAARAFVAFLLGPRGRSLLAAHGLSAPD
jgi:molybdate transport system substrate-binding protein